MTDTSQGASVTTTAVYFGIPIFWLIFQVNPKFFKRLNQQALLVVINQVHFVQATFAHCLFLRLKHVCKEKYVLFGKYLSLTSYSHFFHKYPKPQSHTCMRTGRYRELNILSVITSSGNFLKNEGGDGLQRTIFLFSL